MNQLWNRFNALDQQAKGLVIMGVLSALLVVVALSIAVLSQPDEEEKALTITAPIAASSAEGRQYEEVVQAFTDAGFTDITTEPIKDLTLGWLNKDGEVERVTVGGSESFGTSSRFEPGTPVRVYYHTFPDRPAESPTPAEPTTTAPTTPEVTATPSPVAAPEPTRITPDNNAEFAAVLGVAESYDPLIADFAAKHQGKEIEFDGTFALADNIDSAGNRYTILIYAGDYDPDGARGPSMRFYNVGRQADLKLDSVSTGMNVHIVARITHYNPASSLLELEPVEVTPR